MASRAGDRTLVLHIGLHKTATSYLQNVWSARRYDLLQEGILYPIEGTGSLARGVDRLQLTTRKGAQSGHAVFTRPVEARQALGDLLQELPETVGTVLLSSEDFSLGRVAPERYIELFSDFGTVKEPDHGPGSSLDATLGGGSAHVQLETFSGDIEIRKP